MDFIILTGMSGAGKSLAIRALEDSGYYCVDNLPANYLVDFCKKQIDSNQPSTAIVIDARSTDLSSFKEQLHELRDNYIQFKVVFLDASFEVLLQRYKETRRKHPLLDNESNLIDAIKKEIELLQPFKEKADYYIDTSLISPTQLRNKIWALFCDESRGPISIECMSFGFKYGLPSDADLVFDVRCLPNPHYVPELKPHDGTEDCIRDYVMNFEVSRDFMDRIINLLDFSLPLYISEGKSQIVIAFGCTGGRHRSVVFAQEIGKKLQERGYKLSIIHRDKERTKLV